jgi:predicted ribosomally synthesized peptide with SipW-like signal peptide
MEEITMSNTKKKVLTVAIAVCLIAIISLSTLAWFNAADDAQNNFYIANSEDDADEIFSVDVWEDDTEADTDGETKLEDMEIENIQPGDVIYKEVHIENTGYYDQYIRATITVSQATVWQKVYGVAATEVVPLTDIVQGVDMTAVHTYIAELDTTNDTFVYELYYHKAIAAGQEIIVFETVTINENLDRFQAAEMSGEFFIKVVADAVQVENVGNNVFEAFTTVGLN